MITYECTFTGDKEEFLKYAKFEFDSRSFHTFFVKL